MEILSTLINFLSQKAVPFVILLGILVFVHEFGHFIIARLNGVRVEVFSLGFGKKIFQLKHGETIYCISIIPLGGYVKMFGEQPGSTIPESEKSVSFTHKTVKQRISIVLAGPLMNLFFAILLFGLVASLGEEKQPAILGDISISSPAFEMGFRAGDKILSVAGQSVTTWDDLHDQLNELKDQEASFEISSKENPEPKTLSARVSSVPNPNPVALSKTAGTVEGFQYFSIAPTVAILKGSLLDSLGIKTGDTLKLINGNPVQYWREVAASEKALSPDSQLNLAFERAPSRSSDKLEVLNVNVQIPKAATLASVGIEPSDLYLAEVVKGSPAQKAGLKELDKIVAINGVPLKAWEDILTNIKQYSPESGSLKFSVLRDGQMLELMITPQITSQMSGSFKEEKRFTIGIKPLISMAVEKSIVVRTTNPLLALGTGIKKSYEMTVMTLLSFVRLISGDISPKNVGGVLSIGQAASESFKAGFNYFLQMMGVISISLFVLNLLPIPVLDGGHILFYTIELFKGSPVSLRKMELAQQVGLVLLMSLMIFALFNDVNRVFFGSY
jgi:regulator of sigma E protease